MLDASSSLLSHRLQNIALVWLSFVFLPIDTLVLLLCYAYTTVFGSSVDQRRATCRFRPGFVPRRILVTGVGMTKGLAIARSFYEAGHDVIGADVGVYGTSPCGRFSRTLTRFHQLEKPSVTKGSDPYIKSLLDIIIQEQIDLWVSCSGVASAVEDGQAKEIIEARTSCKAIQFDIDTTKTLHEKDSFVQRTKSIGLNVPQTHRVTNRAQVEDILRQAPPESKYIMKTIGLVDAMRGNMTLLPKSSTDETSAYLAHLPISEDVPWILQQYVKGNEYCTHALVVKGRVKAFVACPSAEMLMHYVQLPSDSPLSQAMLQFTQTYAASGGETFTGHLSFDFLVDGATKETMDPADIVLYPIECNPRAHTAVVLFNGTTQLTEAYLSLLDASHKCQAHLPLVTPVKQDKYCWIGHDVVEKLILPMLGLLTLRINMSEAVVSWMEFLIHLFTWRDGTFEVWDPLPCWWLYHIYWPAQFLICAWEEKRWSRVNVSTTKMFEC